MSPVVYSSLSTCPFFSKYKMQILPNICCIIHMGIIIIHPGIILLELHCINLYLCYSSAKKDWSHDFITINWPNTLIFCLYCVMYVCRIQSSSSYNHNISYYVHFHCRLSKLLLHLKYIYLSVFCRVRCHDHNSTVCQLNAFV